jgi:hypothetical protein
MIENWKDIEEYKGRYQVSDLGRVKMIEHYTVTKNGNQKLWLENILNPITVTKGYKAVRLYDFDHKGKTLKLHRLVAKTFIQNSNNYPQINHINGIKSDNRVDNLEWCVNSYNMDHAMESNLISYGFEKHNSNFDKELFDTIQPLLDCGLTCKQLSSIFGITKGNMSDILTNRYYTKENYNFKVINRFNKSFKTTAIPKYLYEKLNVILKDNTVLNSLIAEGKLKVENQCNA